jgi:hypothetical protein
MGQRPEQRFLHQVFGQFQVGLAQDFEQHGQQLARFVAEQVVGGLVGSGHGLGNGRGKLMDLPKVSGPTGPLLLKTGFT